MGKKIKSWVGYSAACLMLFFTALYVMCGSERIASFMNQGLRLLLLLVVAAGIYVVFRKYHCFEKLAEYNFARSRMLFAQRYHWNRTDAIILLFAVLFGGLFRIWGCNWGITSIFQPDEVNIVKPAIAMAMDQTLYQRTSSYYPAQFVTKLVSVAIGWYYKGHNLVLRNQMVEPYFIYRYFTAVFSTMTIYVSFLIGNYMKKHLGAILACLVAVFPVYVSLAKQVTGDSTSLLFLLITILYSLRYMEEKKNTYLFLMTLGTAMATLEKWHGAVGCGYIALVVIVNSKSILEVMRKGTLSLLSYIGWLGVFSPNMLMHPKWAIFDGFLNIAVYEGGVKPPYTFLLKQYVFQNLLNVGRGVLFLLLLIGIGYMLHNRSKQYIVLTLGILKVLILCFMNRGFIRWELEYLWGILFILALGIYSLVSCKKSVMVVCGYVLSGVLALEFGLGALLYTVVAVHSDQDNRLIQEEYCLEHGITPENSTFGGYTGFQPGGYIARTGTNLSECVDDVFVVADDRVYKKRAVDYAMYAVWEDRNASELLKDCPIVAQFDIVCADVGSIPIVGLPHGWNDFALIIQYSNTIHEVLNGALMGAGGITVYDVSEIPYLQE